MKNPMKTSFFSLKRGLATVALGLLVLGGALSAVHASPEVEGVEGISPEEAAAAVEGVDSTEPTTVRNAYLLVKLQQYLSQANQGYGALNQKLEEARDAIDENRETLGTLEAQIGHLREMIALNEEKIRSVQSQISEKEREVAEHMEAVEFTEIQRRLRHRSLADVLNLMYRGVGLQTNSLQVLLQEGTVSSVFRRTAYFKALGKSAADSLDVLREAEHKIKDSTTAINFKRGELTALRAELDGAERDLEAELTGKETLLNQTLISDEIYRELFASYKEQQEVILNDITTFRTNLDSIEARVTLAATVLTPEERSRIEMIQSEATRNFGIRAAAEFLQLSWPVSPRMGLTAFFADDGYVEAFGVNHRAVDIRIPHNSVIYAPADGVVYRVHDAAALESPVDRLGYGYLTLAHQKGVLTLYGHISAALVREGDFVHRGQIIGLTGGTPGTPGAGGRTTGAHLHMEVWQDGIQVDPLEYLPMEEIPESQWGNLPEQYLRKLEERLSELVEVEVEVKKLSVIHFNDSLKPFNSRRDRRAGEICRNSRNSTYFGGPGGHPFAPRGFRGVAGVVARVTYSHLRV